MTEAGEEMCWWRLFVGDNIVATFYKPQFISMI